MKQLSSSLEDYLECIYNYIKKNGAVKAIEISKSLGVSRASVTEALNKLAQEKYINYGRYENITMTNLGIKKAEEILEKHAVLQSFFENTLGVVNNESTEIACKIEHIISTEVLERIRKLNTFCQSEIDFVEKYIK